MPRKLKYGEPTKTIGFKVPLSKEKEVRKLIEDYLDRFLENKSLNSLPKEEIKRFKSIKKEKLLQGNWLCGCIIENGLLKRAKSSKCKLTKSEH